MPGPLYTYKLIEMPSFRAPLEPRDLSITPDAKTALETRDLSITPDAKTLDTDTPEADNMSI